MIELELSTFVAPVATALLTAVGVYVAIAKQLAASEESAAAMRRDVEEIKRDVVGMRDDLREHGERLARLTEKSDSLTAKVEKHNSVVERTFKLESDMATAWKRHDELKGRVERLEDTKIGGSE